MREIYNEVGDTIGGVELIDHMGNDARIVHAARVSFGRDAIERIEIDDNDRKLIAFLLKNGHTSPFEHCSITWRFQVPLFVRSQHHRHRTWAYNEISRRYTSEDMQFYLPTSFRSQHESNRQASKNDAFDPTVARWSDEEGASHPEPASHALAEHTGTALDLFERLLAAGVAREQARMVLPQNLYTTYYGTVSLHNVFGFLRQRLDPHAQWEIRRVAKAMKADLREIFPHALLAFESCLGRC